MDIPKNIADFLLRAVSRDKTRDSLCAPYLGQLGVDWYLAATDGHRMHLARVSPGPDAQPGYVALTKTSCHRMDRDGRFPNFTQVIPEDGRPGTTLSVQGAALAELRKLPGGIRGQTVAFCTPGEVPSLGVAVAGFREDTPKNSVGMDVRYLGDAAPRGADSVTLHFAGPLDPVVVCPAGTSPRSSEWFSFIMPRRLH